MNQRIREFERDSGLEIFGLGAKRDRWEKAMEKFAMLVANECAEIADKAEPYKANDLIKKHFGVKD